MGGGGGCVHARERGREKGCERESLCVRAGCVGLCICICVVVCAYVCEREKNLQYVTDAGKEVSVLG